MKNDFPQKVNKFILLILIFIVSTSSCSLSPNLPRTLSGPTLIPTISASPTPAVTSTPAPTPTPKPAVRVQSGDQLLQLGDYEKARQEYQSAYDSTQDKETQAAALVGLGRIDYLNGDYQKSSQALITVIEYYPDSPYQSQALYFLAKVYTEQKDYKQAAQAYQKLLNIRKDAIEPFIREKLGGVLASEGDYDGAIAAYETASVGSSPDDQERLKEMIGQVYASKGDHENAVRIFMDLYNSTSKDAVKAEMDLLAGRSYIAMNFPEQAYARYQDAVNNYPKLYSSFAALIDLVNAGIEVNELNRGIANFFADQYGLANEAFDRYLYTNPTHEGKAHYYKALCLVNMNNYGDAVFQFDELINGHPGDALWHDAWEQKAYTLWYYVNRYDQAPQVLLDYVSGYPGGDRAADFLFQAGRILERNQVLPLAATIWERMINEYPSAETSLRGLFLSGITYYRLNNYVKAQSIFQRYLALSNFPADQAAGYLWVGKCQEKLGKNVDAQASWEQAAKLDRTGYYSDRATELLDGSKPFEVHNKLNLEPDLKGERQLAEVWMRDVFNLPTSLDLGNLETLGSEPHFKLGVAYWELGEYRMALAEFETLRKQIDQDPVSNYRLLNHLLYLGFYQQAILTSRHILDLANLDDSTSLNAPLYFNHIRFGTYYKEAVLEAAKETDFNPLFIFSVIRQESMFEGFAGSPAGARGLMQIMPATGKDMATQLKFPEKYTDEDLSRPLVSIILGANYLGRQRNYFGDDLYQVLAAYNAGPGIETQGWAAIAPDDPDLYVEVIRYSETRTYVMQIFEIMHLYQRFYEMAP